MPKTAKYTVDFFSHDCVHKMTMALIEQRYGNDGYALWWKMLEMLGSTKGHFLDFNKDRTIQYLAARAHLTVEKCTEIIDELSDLDAIDKNLWKHKVVWCQNFVDRLNKLYRDRNCSLPPKPLIVSNNGHITITQYLNSSDNPQDIGGSPQDIGGSPQDIGGSPQDIGGSPQILDEICNNKRREEYNKEEYSKLKKSKEERAPHVFLTDGEMSSLKERFGDESSNQKIKSLSLYKLSTGKQYKSDYFTILNWERMDEEKKKTNKKETLGSQKRAGISDDHIAKLKQFNDEVKSQ